MPDNDKVLTNAAAIAHLRDLLRQSADTNPVPAPVDDRTAPDDETP